MSFFCVLLVCCALVLFVSAAPVLQESQLIGVDMGTSFLKVAAFRRYTEFIEKELGWTVNNNNVEMVLNDQTNRKSPPCVAFRYFPSAVKKSENVGADKNVTLVPEGYTLERSFAEQAQVLQPRVPLNVVCSPTSLLLSQDGEETRIPFPKSLGEVRYNAEELTAMLLYYGAHTAEKEDMERNRLFVEEAEKVLEEEATKLAANHSSNNTNTGGSAIPRRQGYTVRTVALALPSRASLRYRLALRDSAALTGLKVGRMAMSCTAAATQLGLLREEELFPAGAEDSVKYVVVYDMGSKLTEASLWSYHKAARRGIADGGKPPGNTLRLVALAVDEVLGGDTFDECIASYWDKTYFNGEVLAGAQDAAHLKQRVSLVRGAARAREMLSANKEASVVVEGLPQRGNPNLPFSTVLTREVFEKECDPLFQKAAKLRDTLMQEAEQHLQRENASLSFSLQNVSRFEVIGGGTRMPRLLTELSVGYKEGEAPHPDGTRVDRTLNGDEAAVMGVTYLGAASAHLVSRQPFEVQEWLPYSVGYYIQNKTNPPPKIGGTSPLKVLFEKKKTILPSIQSIRLEEQKEDFSLVLLSPAENINLKQNADDGSIKPIYANNGTAVEDAVQLNFSIVGVDIATRELSRILEKESTNGTFVEKSKKADKKKNETEASFVVVEKHEVELLSSEVVVETAVSESGLPFVKKAFLQAVLKKTIFSKSIPRPANRTAEEGDGNETATVPVAEEPLDGEVKNVSGQQTLSIPLYVQKAEDPREKRLKHSKYVVDSLNKIDEDRLIISSLRNDLESVLLSIKTMSVWDKEDGNQTATRDWRSEVKALAEWLEDYGEQSSVEVIEAKLEEAKQIKKFLQQEFPKEK